MSYGCIDDESGVSSIIQICVFLVNYLLSWLHTQALIIRIDCCQESNVTVTYLATEIDNLC